MFTLLAIVNVPSPSLCFRNFGQYFEKVSLKELNVKNISVDPTCHDEKCQTAQAYRLH